MYGSRGSPDAIAREMNSLLHSSTFKSVSNGEFAKMKEFVSSDSNYSSYNHHEQSQNQIQRSEFGRQTDQSSLTRYRSAPSSFFANLLEEIGCDDFPMVPVNTNTSNHDPEERFFSNHQQQQQQQQQKFQSDSHEFLPYASSSSLSSVKQQPEETQIQQPDLSPVSAAMYGNGGSSEQVPPSNGNGVYNPNNLRSSSTVRSMNSESSNLIRQSSSPAGIFYSMNSENGFTSMRDGEKTSISSTRLNNHISFSSGQSSTMFLPQIAENRNEMNGSTFRSLKRTRDGDSKTLDKQSGISGHFTPSLVHHMSLPKTYSETAVAEKILHFEQDSTPCKIRAKRGCATHPRSIAERVRRNRINDRLKLLEELFPNMDKQTSTADKLDLAVQHIKDLQKELQTLKDARARCTCSSKPGRTQDLK